MVNRLSANVFIFMAYRQKKTAGAGAAPAVT